MPKHYQFCNRGRTRGGTASGGLAAALDEVGKRRDGGSGGDTEPGAQVVPEGDAEFFAGLAEAKEGVATIAAGVAVGSAADLTFGHLAADVVFRAVGVQRDPRAVEHHQQLGFVGVQPLEQTVKRGEVGAALEDAIETCAQLAASARCWIEPVGLQVGIEPPNQPADMVLSGTLLVGERFQPVHQALGVDPACVRQSPGKGNGMT